MNLDLKGKVVVITGPAKGMGRAVTLGFAGEGAHLVLAGRDTAAIDEVAQELNAMGTEALVVNCHSFFILLDSFSEALINRCRSRN